MVVAFDRETPEIEMSRHAAGFRRRFEHGYLMPLLERVVSGGKSHRAGADEDNAAHQNSSTIGEYTGWP